MDLSASSPSVGCYTDDERPHRFQSGRASDPLGKSPIKRRTVPVGRGKDKRVVSVIGSGSGCSSGSGSICGSGSSSGNDSEGGGAASTAGNLKAAAHGGGEGSEAGVDGDERFKPRGSRSRLRERKPLGNIEPVSGNAGGTTAIEEGEAHKKEKKAGCKEEEEGEPPVPRVPCPALLPTLPCPPFLHPSPQVLPFTQGYDITAHQCVPGQRHALVVNRVFYGGGQVTCTDEMVEKFSPADWPRELDSLTRLKWEDKEAPFLVSFPEGISCLR